MKKVIGFALICFSLGMITACLLNGFLIKAFFIIGSMIAGCLLFHSKCKQAAHHPPYEKRGNQ